MSDAPVNPAEVPVYTGDLPLLQAKVTALAQGGTKVGTAGSDVHKSFGGLSAFYKAPEAEQLFGVTEPVARKAHDLSGDLQVISKALGTYAGEITPLVAQLDQLRQEAARFRTDKAADDDWNEDGDLVEENLARRNKIAEVWSAFQRAERDCYAKIVALVGGTPLKTNDGTNQKGMYGYDAEALKQSKSLPWGDAVEESVPWWQVWEHAYDFGKGVIVDGVWGTIKGLGTLVGVDGWDAAGQAWVNLAKLSTGLTITMIPGVGALYLMAPGKMLPTWLRESRTAMVETGKAMLAWDQWSSNPSRAAGAVTFNVLTALVTRGGTAAVSGAGKAGTAAKALSVAGKVGHTIDPMTYVFKGASAGVSKIGDVMAHLKTLRGVELPKLPDEVVVLPDNAKLTADGTIHLPSGKKVPDAFTRLPNGTYKLPEGTTPLPPGTVRIPAEGPPRFLAEDGTIYRPDGTVEQHGSAAPRDITSKPESETAQPRTNTPAREEQPVLVGVGGRGDEVVRGGADVSGVGRVGDDLPGKQGGGVPPGGAADHLPGGRADDRLVPPSASHEGPTGQGSIHGDSPGAETRHELTASHGEGSHGGEHTTPTGNSEGGSGTMGSRPEGETTTGHGTSLGDGPGDTSVWERPHDEAAPFERGTELEGQIREQLRGSKVKPDDLERTLTNLAGDPAGREIADTIASGRFKGAENFGQVVSSLSHADKMAGGIEQIRLANRLHEMGIRDISFEIKGDVELKPGVRTGEKTDLDVMARDADGRVHGYQFKEIKNPKRLVKKVFDNIKQLDESGADFKTFVIDTKGTMAEHEALRAHQRLTEVYGNTNIQFIVRVEDGILIIPPNGKFLPEGTL
ncbi:hypothetical protein [Streptomyces rimosus]|uniref:hypothetical protein n=1 Tax=Streptomyces rimosus TaxID=1927 RepID=UPI0004BEC861|nr:hypothetical protein [Streptomyces rimosus]